jgi:hypothetical protein
MICSCTLSTQSMLDTLEKGLMQYPESASKYILVLDLHDLTGDYIHHKISRNIVLENGEDKPKRLQWNRYREKKFIGNLTDTRIEVYARATGTATTSNTSTIRATAEPTAHGCKAGSVGYERAATAGSECPIATSFVTYSVDPWSSSLPTFPLKLPVIAINQGNAVTASQIAICSDIITSSTSISNSSSTSLTTTPSSSSTALTTTSSSTLPTTTSAGSTDEFVLWDTRVLGLGELIVMRQQRMSRRPQAQFPSTEIRAVVKVLKEIDW